MTSKALDEKLLSVRRLRKSTGNEDISSKKKFESDRGRVLFSAPLRRLQSKAQVFSLEDNASVRSRLTHSIEVAHVGRYLAQDLKRIAQDHNDQGLAEQCELIETIVETACYLHDIGNPPFGHLGETAIQNWFSDNAGKLYKNSLGKKIEKSSRHYQDFENFDGNPQVMRIALTLQGYPNKCGYNLTFAQIGALLKYPEYAYETPSKKGKISAFTTEADSIRKVWAGLGLPWGQRHPLVLLMEAADDIAYSLSDIEDGIEKRIVREKEVMADLRGEFKDINDNIRECIPQDSHSSSSDKVVGEFVSFRTKMINIMVSHASQFFYENRDDICSGAVSKIFGNNDDYSKSLSIIKGYCLKKFYRSPEAEDIEIAGYNVVYGLLDKFSILLAMSKGDFHNLLKRSRGNDLARRMLGKLPDKLILHYENNMTSADEWYYRLHLIVDHISGMTDDYAVRLFRLLHGIDVKLV